MGVWRGGGGGCGGGMVQTEGEGGSLRMWRGGGGGRGEEKGGDEVQGRERG